MVLWSDAVLRGLQVQRTVVCEDGLHCRIFERRGHFRANVLDRVRLVLQPAECISNLHERVLARQMHQFVPEHGHPQCQPGNSHVGLGRLQDELGIGVIGGPIEWPVHDDGFALLEAVHCRPQFTLAILISTFQFA